VIAPFWTDIDLYGTDGVVYYGHYIRYYAEQPVSTRAAEVFDTVQLLVRNRDTGFLPTEVVTVTWHDVAPYPGWYYRYYYYFYYYYYYYHWYRYNRLQVSGIHNNTAR